MKKRAAPTLLKPLASRIALTAAFGAAVPLPAAPRFSVSTTRSLILIWYQSAVKVRPRTGLAVAPKVRLTDFSGFSGFDPSASATGLLTATVEMSTGTPAMKLVEVVAVSYTHL